MYFPWILCEVDQIFYATALISTPVISYSANTDKHWINISVQFYKLNILYFYT